MKFPGVFNLKRESVLLVFFPYLAVSYPYIQASFFFNIYKVVLFVCCVALADYVARQFFKEQTIFHKILGILLLTVTVLLFYGSILLIGIQIFLNNNTGLGIVRGQVLFLILAILLIIVQVLFFKKREAFLEIVNIFLILLTVVSTFSAVKETLVSTDTSKYKKYSANRIHLLPASENDKYKPVLLIIADEYSSPVELFKVFQDSSVFEFSKKT